MASGFQFNRDYQRRNRLLKLPKNVFQLDVAQFRNLRLPTLKTLLSERFIDPREHQNEAPSVAEFFEFMMRWPKVRAHGFAISHQRKNYSISLEGLHCPAHIRPTLLVQLMFFDFCKHADVLRMDSRGLWAWWD